VVWYSLEEHGVLRWIFYINDLVINWLELESEVTFECTATFMSMWRISITSHTLYAGVIRDKARFTFS
jgi:hypothetical protein